MYHLSGRVKRSSDPMFRADDIFAPPEDRGRIRKLVRTDAELAATIVRWTVLGREISGVVPELRDAESDAKRDAWWRARRAERDARWGAPGSRK